MFPKNWGLSQNFSKHNYKRIFTQKLDFLVLVTENNMFFSLPIKKKKKKDKNKLEQVQ